METRVYDGSGGKNTRSFVFGRSPTVNHSASFAVSAVVGSSIDRPAGQVLTTEGQRGYEFFIVLEGEVEVRQGDRVIATRRTGDYVGEIALLDERPRTATVVATTPVSVEVLSRGEFMSLLAEVPELSGQIMAA